MTITAASDLRALLERLHQLRGEIENVSRSELSDCEVCWCRLTAARLTAAIASGDELNDSVGDVAEAMRAYAKQAKNRQLEVDAAEIRIRAERRVGELIVAQKQSVGLRAGARGAAGPGRGKNGVPQTNPVSVPTLAEAGIDKKLSARAQLLLRCRRWRRRFYDD